MSQIDPAVSEGCRRTVGVSALRRLRRLVDEENAQERSNAFWAFRLGLAFALAAGLLLLWLANRVH